MTALNRLGGFYNNNTIPGQGNYQQIDPTISAQTNALQGDVGTSASNLMGTPSLSSQGMSLGGQLSGIFGNGQVATTGPSGGDVTNYGNLARDSAYQSAGAPSVAQSSLALGDTLAQRLGSGSVDKQAGDVGQYGAMAAQAANSLQNTPDRMTLAQNALDAFNKQNDIGLKQSIDTQKQQDAAMGRTGMSQDVNHSLYDIATTDAANRNAYAANLANQLGSGTLQDNIAKMGALQGAQGQAFSQSAENNAADLARKTAAYGLGSGVAGTDASNQLARTGTLGNLQGQAFGQANTNAGNQFARQQAGYGLGAGLAGQNASNQLGQLSGLSGAAGQSFGQNLALAQAQQQAQQQGINYAQQGIGNQLANNQQNFGQLVQMGAMGNPYNVQDTYNNMASLEANKDAVQQAQNTAAIGSAAQGLGSMIPFMFPQQQASPTNNYYGY